MNFKSILISVSSLLLTTNTFALSPRAQKISECIKANDTPGVYNEFAKWEKEEPNSPNITDTWAWYYYSRAYNQNIQIDSVRPTSTDDYMELLGEDGKKEFIYAEILVNCDSLKKGLEILDNSITKHPDCMDLYLTKGEILITLMQNCSHKSLENDGIILHSEKGNRSEQEQLQYLIGKALSHPTIIGDKSVIADLANEVANNYCKMLDRSKINSNNWYDLFDKKIENGENRMLEVLQAVYLNLLQNAEYESASTFNDRLLSVYPDRYDFRTNKALNAMYNKEYNSAMIQLEVLHKEFPKDDIITANLAELYGLMGNTKQSRKLYKSLINSSNEEISNVAKMKLEEIK